MSDCHQHAGICSLIKVLDKSEFGTMVVQDEKLVQFILSGALMSVPNVMAIHPKDVETIHSKPQMLTHKM